MKTNGFGHPSWNKWIFVRILKYFFSIFTSNSSYGCEPFLLIFIDWNILWSKIEYIINAQFTLSLFNNGNILWISCSPSLFTHIGILLHCVFVLLWAIFLWMRYAYNSEIFYKKWFWYLLLISNRFVIYFTQ